MKIVQGFPPNIQRIWKTFKTPPNAVFTYGDTIYNPSGGDIDTYLETHEATHMRQQGDNPFIWWKTYLINKKFRLDQEVEAYQNQYLHFCSNKKDYGRQQEFLDRLAKDLSSSMYGNITTFYQAKEKICQR